MPYRISLAFAVAILTASAANAQELIVGATPTPTSAETLSTDVQSTPGPEAQANGDWARRVMADAAEGKPSKTDDQQARTGCVRNPDRQPHGEVWGSVGTGGYKGGGVIVTRPVGDCGTVTVGYEQQSGGRRRGRR